MSNDSVQSQVEVIGIQEIIKMEKDFNPEKIETVIASLKKKEESLADSIGKLGVHLENEIQSLNELKKKERKSNSKKANDQINKRVTEIAKLTVQFIDHLDQLTKKGLYAHRLALISTYKPLMHWRDQKQFDQLLTDKDKKNGFKELCDKNLFLKLKHTDPKLFNRCTECLVSSTYETVLSVSNAITYGELFDFSDSKKFLLLTDFISEVYPNDDVNRKNIMSEVQNRPYEAMAKLFDLDKKLYKQFLRIELAEDFDRAQSVIRDIKICRLKEQEKDDLIADVNRRLVKFKPREIVLARSMKKLEASDKSLSQKFRAISEDSLEWKKEIEKVRNLIIENQFKQTIKEKIQNDPELIEELRNVLLKNLEVSNISPSSKESMNREKSKGEEKMVACFLYSHYIDLENQKKIVLKVQSVKDSLQTINSKFLVILKKIENDRQIALERYPKQLEHFNNHKKLIEMWQVIPENQLKGEQIADKDKDIQDKDKAIKAKGKSSVNEQSKEVQVELTVAGRWDQYKQEIKNIHSKYSDLRNKIFNDKDVPFRMKKQLLKHLEKHIALSKKLVVAERLDFYGQKLDNLQKTRGEILNYQNFSPKNELAKEIVQLLTSGQLPNYYEKIRENDLNFLELRDQVTKDSKLPLDEKEALVQKISSCIIADREQGYKVEMSLFASDSKKLLALQDEISKDEELPTDNKKTLNRQIVNTQYEKQIFRTTIHFKNLAFKIQKDSLLLETDKHKLSETLKSREELVKRSLGVKNSVSIPGINNDQKYVRFSEKKHEVKSFVGAQYASKIEKANRNNQGLDSSIIKNDAIEK